MPRRASARGSRSCRGPCVRRDRLDAPGGGQVGARLGVVERTSAGQQGRQAAGLDGAAVAGAARDPGQAGAGLCRRRRRAAVKPPGTEASRSPTRMIAPASSSSAARAAGSSPGHRLDQLAGHLAQAARRVARDRDDLDAVSRTALRSRRKMLPASSSGSRPTSTTVDAFSRSANVTSSWRRGDVRGEERGLLGGVRAGPEVDVVGAQHRAGELAVGEGVLGGQPAAGQHADLAARPRPGPGRRPRGPRATRRARARRSRRCGPAGS